MRMRSSRPLRSKFNKSLPKPANQAAVAKRRLHNGLKMIPS
jgi:hypothetical protein